MVPDGDVGHATDGDRFVVRGKLGVGGMGVVYRAQDRLAGREVALKTLKTTSGRDLYRFKREFRSLCDLVHPNLCALYELHTTGDEWFFTMEMIHGVSFIDWVRPPADGEDRPADGEGEVTRPEAGVLRSRAEVMEAKVVLARLEDAIGQLCDGVHALHRAGKLHRDLKPSNVLVEAGGRVVLLDFGLVADVEPVAVDHTHDRSAVGTPAYMSPEQAMDTPLTAASDWYAVGVMLYEALTGRRPFEGRADEVMRRKQHEVPQRPRDLAPATPAALDELCMGLLAGDPKARPDGVAVLAALGRQPSDATATVARGVGAGQFVGREAQLAVLEQALLDSRKAGVAVLVRGSSGMGKSALVGHFVNRWRDRALILSSRCYQRESVPFKTLDTLVDAITGTLLELPEGELQAVLPADVIALARLFPVLRRVPQIAEPEIRRFHLVDAQELRRRGFAALRELLAALAVRGPLVVCIDDLQWGDADSAVFLADLIARVDRPDLLVLLVYRSEDEDSPVVTTIARHSRDAFVDVRRLDVGALTADEARELVRMVAPERAETDDRADALLHDAGGNTMFLTELAQASGVDAASLDELLRRRIARLPADARTLLRACAVAARPTSLETVARAAGIADATASLAVLRVERLVRPTQTDRARVETYHDRIRAAIVDDLEADDLRDVHQRLADAYRADTSGTRDAIVDHLIGAGDRAGAAIEAEHAAARAIAALAFARAADLYEVALRHGAMTGAERVRLLRARADALVDAGQPTLAAASYAEAAGLATGDDRRRLELARIENSLRAGAHENVVELARAVLSSIGYDLPTTRAAAVRKVTRQRLWLRVRGLNFTPRRTPLSAAERRISETLWALATGFSSAEPMLGKVVQHWHLRHALELGEPTRVLPALAFEVAFSGTEGEPQRDRVAKLELRARRIAADVDEPHQRAFLDSCTGMARTFFGDWRTGRKQLEDSLAIMREHGRNLRWQIDITEIYLLGALYYLGDIAALIRCTTDFLRDAEVRGDLHSQHGIKAWRSNVMFLALDQPDVARANLDEVASQRGPSAGFTLHHLYELYSRCQIDLYRGDGAAAAARIAKERTAIDASQLMGVQNLRLELTFVEGRAAVLQALAAPAERGRHLAVAGKHATTLRGEAAAWGQALGVALTAACAHVAGDRAQALVAYDDARVRFGAGDMTLHEQCMILAASELRGADPDAAVIQWMLKQGVGAPATMSRFIAPRPRVTPPAR